MNRSTHLLAVLFAAAVLATPALALKPDGGHALTAGDVADHVSDELDRRLAAEATANIEKLRREGRLASPTPKVSGMVWPLGPIDGAGTAWHGISNFVDLEPAFPSQLRDYVCSTRTYDTAAGYNHRGIDYFTFPFPWKLMDDDSVHVRAAAPGVLVARGDGNNDRSCSFNSPDTPNYAIVRHSDGTVARYLHMKNGSVTTRPIGSAIAAGEILGVVGSSGVSTGPHLHLELRANETAGAAVIEPHSGTCNNITTAWAQQRPYRDPSVNRLSTHSAAPVSPACSGTTVSGTDQPNFKTVFAPGDPIVFLAAYRDQAHGQVTSFRVIRPDSTVHQTWSLDSALVNGTLPVYNASYWYWNMTVPTDAQAGLWQFEATYQGVTKRHHYRVGNSTTAIADMKGLIGAWFEPATSGQGFELHWINGDIALLFFYGHHDDGENFFLLGQRNGMWDFNQEVVFDMYQTTGGRWTDFDPAQIQRPIWGQARVTFVNCESAVVELDGLDGTQVLNLQRLGRTVGLDCD
jgi:murein DD-endopeptidase MepM/ murein hydrolase activator NlpD